MVGIERVSSRRSPWSCWIPFIGLSRDLQLWLKRSGSRLDIDLLKFRSCFVLSLSLFFWWFFLVRELAMSLARWATSTIQNAVPCFCSFAIVCFNWRKCVLVRLNSTICCWTIWWMQFILVTLEHSCLTRTRRGMKRRFIIWDSLVWLIDFFLQLKSKTESFWSFVLKRRESKLYNNVFYDPKAESGVVLPSITSWNIVLWPYYLRYHERRPKERNRPVIAPRSIEEAFRALKGKCFVFDFSLLFTFSSAEENERLLTAQQAPKWNRFKKEEQWKMCV